MTDRNNGGSHRRTPRSSPMCLEDILMDDDDGLTPHCPSEAGPEPTYVGRGHHMVEPDNKPAEAAEGAKANPTAEDAAEDQRSRQGEQ